MISSRQPLLYTLSACLIEKYFLHSLCFVTPVCPLQNCRHFSFSRSMGIFCCVVLIVDMSGLFRIFSFSSSVSGGSHAFPPLSALNALVYSFSASISLPYFAFHSFWSASLLISWVKNHACHFRSFSARSAASFFSWASLINFALRLFIKVVKSLGCLSAGSLLPSNACIHWSMVLPGSRWAGSFSVIIES